MTDLIAYHRAAPRVSAGIDQWHFKRTDLVRILRYWLLMNPGDEGTGHAAIKRLSGAPDSQFNLNLDGMNDELVMFRHDTPDGMSSE